jgi:hypothetical protein
MTSFLISIANVLQVVGVLIAIAAAAAMGYIEHKKLTPNKKNFALIAFFGGFLSLLGQCYSTKDNDNKTAIIIQQGEKIKDAQTKQTQNLDELIIKSDQRTVESLEERERVLNEFDKVSARLSQITENENLKIELGKPELSFVNDPLFVLKENTKFEYTLRLQVQNIGDRTADKINLNTLLIEHINEKVTDKMYPEGSELTIPTSFIPPINKSGTGASYNFKFIFPNADKIENYDNSLVLFVRIKYIDKLTGKKDELVDCFSWRSFSKNSYNFVKANRKEYDLIKKFMKENNIHI